MMLPSLLLCLLFGFSVAGDSVTSEHPDIDLYFHSDEVAHHIRNQDGEHALLQATMRRIDDHFRVNETIHELLTRDVQNKEINGRATVFYKPNLNAVCTQNGQVRAHPYSTRNVCVSGRQFSVDCEADAEGDHIVTVHGYCQTDYFCVTVLRDSLHIVDPDNLQFGQAAEPICQKRLYFRPFQIKKTAVEFMTDWWTAPGKFKVAFGRMAVLGDTAGVSYKLKFEWKHVKSTLWNVAGIKSIESENSGADHEYELSYNYNGADDYQFRAVTEGLDEVAPSKNLVLNAYFGAAS